MTGVMALAVPLIVLGVVYALMYVRWPPRSRNKASLAVDTERAAGRIERPEPDPGAGPPWALTLAAVAAAAPDGTW
jgi:hypothetical protein